MLLHQHQHARECLWAHASRCVLQHTNSSSASPSHAPTPLAQPSVHPSTGLATRICARPSSTALRSLTVSVSWGHSVAGAMLQVCGVCAVFILWLPCSCLLLAQSWCFRCSYDGHQGRASSLYTEHAVDGWVHSHDNQTKLLAHRQVHVTLGFGITAAVHLVKAHNRSTLRKRPHPPPRHLSPPSPTPLSRSYTCSYGNVTGSIVVTFATRTLYTAEVVYREATAPAATAKRVVATVTTFTQGNPDGAHYIHRVSWTRWWVVHRWQLTLV